MEQIAHLMQAFTDIFCQFDVSIAIVLGVFVGVILGSIPGLSSTVGIALIIPFSFYLSPLAAILMMYAVHKAGTYGGSITAILINTPGTAAAACTQLDGYPLTQMGKQGKALKTAAIASAIGDLLSDLVLIFGTVYLAKFVWEFGPVEMAAILFFSLTLIATVTGKSVVKGLFAAGAGLLLALIGLDPVTYTPRLTFGILELENGLSLIPVLMGLFVVSEVLIQAESNYGVQQNCALAPKSKDPADNRVSLKEFKSILPAIFSSYIVGQIIGILPGLGSAIAPWISYGQAKSFSKHPEKFGKGSIEGVAAAESANNAVCGANLMPLLTLGVPGSTDAALIMGVFMINGIEFGPRIFEEHTALVYGIFAAGLLAILGYFLIGMFMAEKVGGLITKVPKNIIYPVILIITFVGAYSTNNSLFDTVILMIFGIFGYLMRKFSFPIPPMIIAFMLGYKFETALRQSLLIARGNIGIFLTRPISLCFILLSAAIVVLNYMKWRKNSLLTAE